ncbi:LysR family transcriptional regulator [Pseudomonas sp.]|jgi:DNA-binding transcriptional LysR family regulator|uniref:LysR family transcriptional regulator n=1 Tax=Pseudomonas sp. TaxID=306 RepID=UPI0028AD7D33|nr:LysR family transcriptional regulator [Pseudomonas sp.]
MSSLERFSDLQLFSRIVAGGSLSAAARELGLSLAVVSARLARLEATLGVRLLTRSTRRLSLTGEGEEFLARSTRILAEIAELQDSLGRSGEPHGRLRVTCTAAFGRRHIAPRVAAFRRRYPQVTLELLASDAIVDLVQDGVDLAIRQAALPDSNLHVRTLLANRRIACASPAYLAEHAPVQTPEDLLAHACILIGDPPMSRWNFVHNDSAEERLVSVAPAFQTNDGEIAHAAALDGAGIVFKSLIDVREDLASGALIDVLPDWQSPGSPIQAVYPAGRHLPSRVRVFIDFLCEELAC